MNEVYIDGKLQRIFNGESKLEDEIRNFREVVDILNRIFWHISDNFGGDCALSEKIHFTFTYTNPHEGCNSACTHDENVINYNIKCDFFNSLEKILDYLIKSGLYYGELHGNRFDSIMDQTAIDDEGDISELITQLICKIVSNYVYTISDLNPDGYIWYDGDFRWNLFKSDVNFDFVKYGSPTKFTDIELKVISAIFGIPTTIEKDVEVVIKEEPEETKSRSVRWTNQVKYRDGCCLRCGSDESLEAHHIVSFSKCNQLSDDIDNGVTLCYNCHKEYHSRYGNQRGLISLMRFIEDYKHYKSPKINSY